MGIKGALASAREQVKDLVPGTAPEKYGVSKGIYSPKPTKTVRHLSLMQVTASTRAERFAMVFGR